MSLKEKIQGLAQSYHEEIRSWRRHIHAHPELSFHEEETAKYIASILEGMGLQPERNIGGNGLAVVIEGGKSGKTKALRADFDALPIQEENTCAYASTHAGVMHACGHDVHTSCLLGAVKILHETRNDWAGKVKFIFQHAEEMTPGGAKQMIQAGVLENPRVEEITGQHVYPDLEVGKVGFRKGMYMASTDELFIEVVGKGGHAALPHTLKDPVYGSAQLIVALQTIISRHRPPHIPSVLSIGKVEANGSTNVIPEKVSMMGTFRAMDEAWREKALGLIEKTVKEVSASLGLEGKLRIGHGYPYLENDPDLTQRNKSLAEEYLGKENVIELDLRMTGEDFSYYGHEIPACFYRLGTRNEAKGLVHGLHTSKFDVDEEALRIGAGLMAFLAAKG